MRKYLSLVFLCVLGACSSGSNVGSKPLVEILSQQPDGGARIPFFELLTESKEIYMLQNDPLLRKKIKDSDLNLCNFVILNAGEQESYGYQFSIDQATETQDSIVIKTKLIPPSLVVKPEKDVYYTPFTVLKINSKKPILYK